MDAARIAQVERDLVAWGVVEVDGGPRLTRRFRAGLARAAAALQREEASGLPVPGNPLENAAARALSELALPPGAVATGEHRAFVVAVEAASLPPGVRALLGL